ncbi:MAG TPA: M1 family aminopeptidase, partial [Bacteroidia bacterium]|nr:M1 family aminopeptidase [Bacteroidia bacterium]
NQKVKETESIETFDKNDMQFPASDSENKTLEFKQQNVHDFAWFCDKRYHVLKGEIETPHTKHKVTTWAFFTNAEGNLWKKSISYINDAIYYYSLWNGDYPYNHCTAVDGTISAGTGMEYPNITVIGTANNAFRLDQVITHEVGHNWFYGMLGSNERMHPWMDEGINSFNELRYIELKYPDHKLLGNFADLKRFKFLDLQRYKHKAELYLTYMYSASTNSDQPIETPAYDYTKVNYGACVYEKTALVFDYLMAYIGEKKMDEAMQRYFEEWKFKHPQPADFRKIMEEVTGKNLDWFFDDLINSTKKLDYKIAFAHKNTDGSWDLGVKNTGQINGPVFIQGVKDKKLVGELNYTGFPGKQALTFPPADIDYFKIDFAEDMPEKNRKNNTVRTKGILKTVEPFRLQFLGSLNNPTRTQLFWTPVAGWNNYNKWMLGAAFYNSLIPRKNFEFELMPLYSYSTNDLAGYGHLSYTFYPTGNVFQNIQLGIVGTRYAMYNVPFNMNFNKIAPELTIELKKKKATGPFTNKIKYRHITIIEDVDQQKFENNSVSHNLVSSYSNFHDLTYTISKKDVIMPYSLSANFQQGENMCKAALTAKYSYQFRKKNKGVEFRFFAGTFIGTSLSNGGPYRFRMSGQRGYQDYLYDHIYLGRTETDGILANQFTETDGGFKFYSPVGQTSKWLTALNIKSSLGNLKLLISLYADIGTMADDGISKEKFLYDAGVALTIRKDIFEIYFPLLISNDLEKYKTTNDLKYLETIRFTLNLNLLNPFEFIRNFSL